MFYNDKNMKSCTGNEINRIIGENHDKEVILVDLNNSQMAENSCQQVIYLMEPSIVKLNKLLMTKPRVADEVKNKLVVLNKTVISEKDLNTFQYETKINPFAILRPVDDHQRSEEVYDFLRKLGFDRI